ncbi:alpha/beta fold hydrolase [Streptomyces sp. NPDC102370]|uniref:alpha/beta fold hydrolase n=1 Tax=Streptomyces sp. NPDC102370 TaxID=3366163 RepID=UPI0037FFF06C
MTTSGSALARDLTVPVHGGRLAVTHWPGDGPPVVALHGITANSLAFAALADALPGIDLYAPDLRGRAGSAELPGPYGPGAHVDDVVAVLDHLGLARAVLVGHSMGAFVAALAAARHPDRFPRVVLVDGGLGFPPPPGTDIDALLKAVIGPAMDRLSMTFESAEDYLAFFRAHPALAPHWGPQVTGYVTRDLTGRAPGLRSSCVLDAVRADGAAVLHDPEVLAAVHRPQVRGELLWAERGLLDEPQGLYDAGRVAAAALHPARMPARRIDGTNHYSVLFRPAVDEVAAAVRDAVDAPAGG